MQVHYCMALGMLMVVVILRVIMMVGRFQEPGSGGALSPASGKLDLDVGV